MDKSWGNNPPPPSLCHRQTGPLRVREGGYLTGTDPSLETHKNGRHAIIGVLSYRFGSFIQGYPARVAYLIVFEAKWIRQSALKSNL